MRLNRVEKILLNNPARSMIQKFYEAPLLLRLGGRLDGKRVLEVGCGRGVGIEIILKQFGAQHVCALEFDPEMAARARRRLSDLIPHRVQVVVGDVAAIGAPDESFDAVFDFGVIHHVPAWEVAIREIQRVLKPGGMFLFEEVSKQALESWLYRMLFDHPGQNRFTASDFVAELDRCGIRVGDRLAHRFFGDFFMGVGYRVPNSQRLGAILPRTAPRPGCPRA